MILYLPWVKLVVKILSKIPVSPFRYFIFIFLVFSSFFSFTEGAILRTGRPLTWIQAKPFLHPVRLSGARQFLHHYQRCQGLVLPHFLWGDEIEYGVFRRTPFTSISKGQIGTTVVDTEPPPPTTPRGTQQHYDLQTNAHILRSKLQANEQDYHDLPIGCEWQPEYGSWMVESVPRNPYGSYISDLLNVEKSMQLRRKRLHSVLSGRQSKSRTESEDGVEMFAHAYQEYEEIAPTMSVFPMLGVYGYPHTEGRCVENNGGEGEGEGEGKGISNSRSQSNLVSDRVINPHPRFLTLTENIRQRKQKKVDIVLPLDTDIEKIVAIRGPVDEIATGGTLTVSDSLTDTVTDTSVETDTPVETNTWQEESGIGVREEYTEFFAALESRKRDPETERVKNNKYECRHVLVTTANNQTECVSHTETDTHSESKSKINKTKQEIHLDAMAFGMGCCCLQVTMQCGNEAESRFLHDQLAILAPCLQALSAATPMIQGRLLATDTRWGIISQAVDDRTAVEDGSVILSDEENERGSERKKWVDPQLAGAGVRRLNKSRYSSGNEYEYNLVFVDLISLSLSLSVSVSVSVSVSLSLSVNVHRKTQDRSRICKHPAIQ
jgi:glutamate--cysteine ligase catalytic subunit